MGKIKKYTTEELVNIMDKLPSHVYWTDKNSVILGCNEKQAKYAGFSKKEEMIGKTDHDMPWSQFADAIIKVNNKVMKSKKELITEERIVLPNGKEAFFLSIKTPMFDKSNNVTGILGISTDITVQKLAEKKKRSALLQAKKQKRKAETESETRRATAVFAGSIAHDLRIPLSSLMILNDLFSHSFHDVLKKIKNEKKLASLISKDVVENLEKFPIKFKKIILEMNESITVTLKSMQRLVAGTLSFEDFTICHIEECLYDVIDKYPFQGNQKNLIVMENINHFSFLGIPVLFYRVLFNLINNSLQQINKAQKGQIFISTEIQKDRNVLRFKDTAGGASAKIDDHLFDGYRTTRKEGTGVGLAFCKLAMDSFDGDISCHSVEGDYIEFILTFPNLESGKLPAL